MVARANPSSDAGFTLVEVLLATALFAFVAFAAFETLRHLGIGGTVRLRLSITARGNVEHVELLGGNPILAESAMIAVSRWVYASAKARTTAEVSLAFGDH